ncbi:MAG: sigma factor [Candidatus Sulfotelmatobacter sp.]
MDRPGLVRSVLNFAHSESSTCCARAYSLSGREELTTEDVLQEIFLQLWRVPDAFDPAKGSLTTWLTIVSRRRAIDRLRERRGELDVADVHSERAKWAKLSNVLITPQISARHPHGQHHSPH